jgi:hypothetical protein
MVATRTRLRLRSKFSNKLSDFIVFGLHSILPEVFFSGNDRSLARNDAPPVPHVTLGQEPAIFIHGER